MAMTVMARPAGRQRKSATAGDMVADGGGGGKRQWWSEGGEGGRQQLVAVKRTFLREIIEAKPPTKFKILHLDSYKGRMEPTNQDAYFELTTSPMDINDALKFSKAEKPVQNTSFSPHGEAENLTSFRFLLKQAENLTSFRFLLKQAENLRTPFAST
ncbi:hypothetical protein IEQ34_022356 [Dendrobium chrysotoxum]|uniref:Uncharacterized protein n=1 Tax=Dendrobium chrysotoxum TaxID=161865 RepID=A0AAV7FX05_DENCH|nr:hypothetical protein IEQ34_022356 [Dendrobium chrysotoxum]